MDGWYEGAADLAGVPEDRREGAVSTPNLVIASAS
jgi:hypothetical protein